MPLITFRSIPNEETGFGSENILSQECLQYSTIEECKNDSPIRRSTLDTFSWMAIRALIISATILLMIASYISIQPSSSGHFASERAINLLTDFPPFSIEDPRNHGVFAISRSPESRPGAMFGKMVAESYPVPTNLWCENIFLGVVQNDPFTNRIYVIPYVVNLGGPYSGLHTLPIHITAYDRAVISESEPNSGLTLTAVETFNEGPEVVMEAGRALISHLSVTLKWTKSYDIPLFPHLYEAAMRTSIVRGSPYSSMEYIKSTPRIVAEQTRRVVIIDQVDPIDCSTVFSAVPFLVKREIYVEFQNSDHSWLIFVSEPTKFICKGTVTPTPENNFFELRAVNPLRQGMVRIAHVNNCTTGANRVNCEFGRPKNSKAYEQLLRDHADIYPTGIARVAVASASGLIQFDWKPASMSLMSENSGKSTTPLSASLFTMGTSIPFATNPVHDAEDPAATVTGDRTKAELLMYALPHHIDQMVFQADSGSNVITIGCVPTLQGQVCPVRGNIWLLREDVYEVTMRGLRPIREDMKELMIEEVKKDLEFELPLNYRRGAGDTYFSGKMLAKLARIVVIADELGLNDMSSDSQFSRALTRLREGTEVWLNGSAQAPFLYDRSWGGMISCGCNYDGDNYACFNKYPECPSLGDPGQNFGNAFYNDHHFHYGYHIYAAAVLTNFDHVWGRKFHERVLFLIRDIANPSAEDPYFPTWRHKDWYTGFSWANGIIGVEGRPNPNGRNEESSAEAINAYEAIALYGQKCATMFASNLNAGDKDGYDRAILIKRIGELMLSTEIKSAQRYWHVMAPKEGVKRVYPNGYTAKVVGMIWSMLVQQQTWFGSQPWKSIGIQILTYTPASEHRDNIDWIREMTPEFDQSCMTDSMCPREGWSILLYACYATLCKTKFATESIMRLSNETFNTAGGNGHSRSNTLWWIATRRCD